jgi:NAD(P)-dependent dehydrogenase (short-subunit alcohol dehydrogenase family)
MKLKDKIAIVTGAGTGMGRSVALRYAKEKAKVIVAEIDADSGNETVSLIQNEGGDAIFVQTDVMHEEQVDNLVSKTVASYGRIDVLYNNAAVQLHGQDARIDELSTEIWDKTINTNLKSAFLCAKYCIRQMIKTGGGSLIFVGSPTGVVGCAPLYTAYSSAKGGVHALARVIAAGYGKENIRANIIVPGAMNTPLISSIIADEKVRSELEKATMLGRLGKVNEVDGLAVFLASDESSYCTGAFFTADGGLTAL